MRSLFLGIDVGSGSSKAVLATADGEVVDSATVMHEISLPRPDFAEIDAEGVAWAEVRSLCDELFARNDRAEVAGVSISAMGPCLVVTDENFVPLRPAILYGIDSRASAEIDELNEELGAESIFALGGKALSSQAVGPKLRWIERNEPKVFATSRMWFSLSSFLVGRLTGEYVLDHHTASQCDPMYDLERAGWNEDRSLSIAAHIPMPSLAWSSDVVGHVTAEGAKATGIPEGVPVCAGTVDAWAEAFSAGVRSPGDLMLMYGSTMFFVQLLGEVKTHEKLWTTRGIEPGSLSIAAGMSTSGSLMMWLQKLVGDVPFETLLEDAAHAPAGSEGLVMLPYFAGERTPIFDPDARGLLLGLTLRHDRGHVLRAAYEGIGFGIRQIVSFLEDAGEPITRVVAVGGGTKARLWMQIVSDITGRPQLVPERTIGASYGGALMAAIGTGAVPATTDWSTTATAIEPDPTNHATYEQMFRIYNDLYRATSSHMHELADMQSRGSGEASS